LQGRLKEMRPSEAAVTRRLLRNRGLVAKQSLREVANASFRNLRKSAIITYKTL